eukprot:TRINITY_DN27035_c0_g1_i1.p1 TRINITY_DN27035_c0_g1~~TRINITY_DN27035_c0_g1_i1.p1  ORF type:complete len:569 (+),score=85.98 TRINITY_DN27035_c0_g1_i1:75-1781(+)
MATPKSTAFASQLEDVATESPTTAASDDDDFVKILDRLSERLSVVDSVSVNEVQPPVDLGGPNRRRKLQADVSGMSTLDEVEGPLLPLKEPVAVLTSPRTRSPRESLHLQPSAAPPPSTLGPQESQRSPAVRIEPPPQPSSKAHILLVPRKGGRGKLSAMSSRKRKGAQLLFVVMVAVLAYLYWSKVSGPLTRIHHWNLSGKAVDRHLEWSDRVEGRRGRLQSGSAVVEVEPHEEPQALDYDDQKKTLMLEEGSEADSAAALLGNQRKVEDGHAQEHAQDYEDEHQNVLMKDLTTLQTDGSKGQEEGGERVAHDEPRGEGEERVAQEEPHSEREERSAHREAHVEGEQQVAHEEPRVEEEKGEVGRRERHVEHDLTGEHEQQPHVLENTREQGRGVEEDEPHVRRSRTASYRAEREGEEQRESMEGSGEEEEERTKAARRTGRERSRGYGEHGDGSTQTVRSREGEGESEDQRVHGRRGSRRRREDLDTNTGGREDVREEGGIRLRRGQEVAYEGRRERTQRVAQVEEEEGALNGLQGGRRTRREGKNGGLHRKAKRTTTRFKGEREV